MANNVIIQKLPRRIANYFPKLQRTTQKIQKTSSSIGFIKKSLWNNVTPTFAKVSGSFANEAAKQKAEKLCLRSHLAEHYQNLKKLTSTHDQIVRELIEVAGPMLTRLLKCISIQNLRRDNIQQFRTKNNKLRRLIRRTDEVNFVSTVVPVKNLSGFDVDTSCFDKGLRHSFTDKNRFVKRNVAVELEHLAVRVNSNVPSEKKEELHEFLRSCTDDYENVRRFC